VVDLLYIAIIQNAKQVVLSFFNDKPDDFLIGAFFWIFSSKQAVVQINCGCDGNLIQKSQSFLFQLIFNLSSMFTREKNKVYQT